MKVKGKAKFPKLLKVHFQKQYPISMCLIGKSVSFGLFRWEKECLGNFENATLYLPWFYSADPMCSFKQTSPSDEASKKQLLMPHRPSVDHSEEPFQRQRAVSAVSIITSALEGKIRL